MSKKDSTNLVEIFLGEYGYSIDHEGSVLVCKQRTDHFGNKYFTKLISYNQPTGTYSHDEYDALRTIINRLADLEYHLQLKEALRD